MENIIILAINCLRPPMEEIYYAVKSNNEEMSMEEFKNVFDNLYDKQIIDKYEDRDSYFLVDKPENNNSEVVDITEDNNSLERGVTNHRKATAKHRKAHQGTCIIQK